MQTLSTHEITQLLAAWNDGDHLALEQQTDLVHTELHRIARRRPESAPGIYSRRLRW